VVKALSPYDKEIEYVNKQLGAIYLRQNMRNASGASTMNAKTQVGELHGKGVTELAGNTYEENIYFALAKTMSGKKNISIINFLLNYLSSVPEEYFELIKQAESNGATPNEALMAPLALLGDNKEFHSSRNFIKKILALYVELNIRDLSVNVDWKENRKSVEDILGLETGKTRVSPVIGEKLNKELKGSNILSLIKYVVDNYKVENGDVFVLSGFIFHLYFNSLVKKRITKDTFENIYAYFSIIAKTIILSTIKIDENKFIKDIIARKSTALLETSFTETAFWAIFNAKPKKTELKEFSTLLGITLTNGPGTISAKGAKESVSARNNISTAFIGFLSNTGLAHGGNGYEGIEYMLKAFDKYEIEDPGKKSESIDIQTVADMAAKKFAEDKKQAKSKGVGYKRIPGINHPVFKGKSINIDPREEYIYKQFEQEGIDNIFWDFYRELVKSLHRQKVTKNVYCVNIDAVIATITLKLLWKLYKSGQVNEAEMQKIGFNLFLFGRTAGIAAEIDDHRNRGTDMDCRTPASQTRFVV